MYSKEESRQVRQQFWTSFGKSFPRKWLLYNTKIKDVSFKFAFGIRNAMVSLDIEDSRLAKRIEIWEKIIALKSILLDKYIPRLVFEDCYLL